MLSLYVGTRVIPRGMSVLSTKRIVAITKDKANLSISIIMVRISGVNIPNNKHLWVALTAIYGVGPTRSKAILASCKIELNRQAESLSEEELGLVRDELKKYTLE